MELLPNKQGYPVRTLIALVRDEYLFPERKISCHPDEALSTARIAVQKAEI